MEAAAYSIVSRRALVSGHDTWGFVMAGREQLADVMLGLLETTRPKVTQRVLAEIVRAMDWHGEATFTRQGLATSVKAGATMVSNALTELEKMQVITKRHGPRRSLIISVNSLFATMLRAGERAKAQENAPPIVVPTKRRPEVQPIA